MLEPISIIYSSRVAKDFLGLARRDEEAVAQATATRINEAGQENIRNPRGIRPILRDRFFAPPQSAISTLSSSLIAPHKIDQYRG